MGSWIFTAMLSKFSFPLETFQSIRLLSKTVLHSRTAYYSTSCRMCQHFFPVLKKKTPSESGSLKDFQQDL